MRVEVGGGRGARERSGVVGGGLPLSLACRYHSTTFKPDFEKLQPPLSHSVAIFLLDAS